MSTSPANDRVPFPPRDQARAYRERLRFLTTAQLDMVFEAEHADPARRHYASMVRDEYLDRAVRSTHKPRHATHQFGRRRDRSHKQPVWALA